MSDIKDQEHLRDSITSMLELSRASWKNSKETTRQDEQEDETPFPRSMLFKTLCNHPFISAATVASVWYFGPARFGAMAVAGVSLFMRHRISIMPIAQHIISTRLSKPRNTGTDASFK